MITGWHGDEYLILFEEQLEAIQMTGRYGIQDRIPSHTLIGLRDWDDFILMSSEQRVKITPTVPLDSNSLEDWDLPDWSQLQADPKIEDKIKWHVTPIVLGGSPSDEENLTWVSLDQHVDLVRWWNDKYDDIRNQQAEQDAPPNR